MKKFTLYFTIMLAFNYLLKAQDYINDKLYSVYGNEYYKGANDCKATVRLESKNNSLLFTIDVEDDSVSITNDWRNSDHIEIWFNMDADSNDYFVYNKEFYGGGRITNETRENFRDYLLHQVKHNDSLRQDIKNAELPIVKEINGMTHWAINLKDSTAFLYDTEYYLKLPVGTGEHVSQKIKIIPSYTKQGYKVIIEFKPETLLFLKNSVNKDVTFMVDVFDIDGNDKNLNVLSTVQNRKWGAPERFNHISVKNPIIINGQKVPKSIKRLYTFYYRTPDNKWQLYKREIIKAKPNDLFYTFKYVKITP